MVEPLAEVIVEVLGPTVQGLNEVTPRRRRWKIARMIALVLIFGLIVAFAIAILLLR